MNESFYYPVQCLQKYLNSIKSFLNGSEPLFIITGDRGFGKTALLSAFYHSGDAPADMLILKGRNSLTPDKFINTLCSEWHLDVPAETEKQSQVLTNVLEQMQQLPQSALLIIDNVDRIPIATLAAIMHLCIPQKENHIAVKFILFGKPSFEKVLANLHFSDIHFEKLELKPLTKEETHRFLLESLKSMQPLKTATIDEPTVAKIYQHSHGVPKDVAQMAEEIIQTNAMQQTVPLSNYSLTDIDDQQDNDQTPNATTDSALDHVQATQPNHSKSNTGWIIKIICLILLVGLFYGFHYYQDRINNQTHALVQPAIMAKQPILPKALQPNVNINKNMPATDKPKIIAATSNHINQPQQADKTKTQPITANYYWQVMASPNKQPLLAFQKQLQLINQPSYILQKQIKDKDWFTLNIGHYPNKQAAKQARLNFPKLLLKHRPWLQTSKASQQN